ncbi:MAG: DUF5107 domain-containing protein [Armatimonadetes bacterium]|nr:DUF5107 domain-containing protein [Armatimonadota bacterium]
MTNVVRVRRESVTLPTYEPAAPDRNPMFLERRVYQGSSGKVYPLPVVDRIAETAIDREWDAIYLDNGLVEVMLLPQIGGRIHAIRDLTNGYDAVYRQHVIKPALVGLAGPWISGGIEFNWPQHHRPSTFMPTEVAIENHEDGSVTVWMSEHEPMNRMKGMHGVCLGPGSSVVEIKARLYNRTPYTQTFLWWANIATRVHEAYKSFFPPDAHLVADHAKRAVSAYPLCEGYYYGVDYGTRGQTGIPKDEKPAEFLPRHCGGDGPDYAPNDLSWYANIPVPTSYMCIGTDKDFFGGYDFFAEAGLMHVADHHISPGKKQWTWGNHEFGYAWDRNLTDADGPYIEIMAGVFTDNQPDFSFLAPGETKAFSQFLYPYQKIGPAQFATTDGAISITPTQVGVAVTRNRTATIKVRANGKVEAWNDVSLGPGQPWIQAIDDADWVGVYTDGQELLAYEAKPEPGHSLDPATEPPQPSEIDSADELFLTGLHLSQYRHATRSPELYWREALRRDPGDLRCNNAIGLVHLHKGEFGLAREHFQRAVERSTFRNPNPYDGEPLYNLGLALRFLDRPNEAEEAFAKAAWNRAWQAPAFLALAELACARQDWKRTEGYLKEVIQRDTQNLKARNLSTTVRRKMGIDATPILTLADDQLDAWARHLSGQSAFANNGIRLDIVIDLMRAGLYPEALDVLENADKTATDGTAPMVAYYEATVRSKLNLDPTDAYQRAQNAIPDYCFPSRLEDIAVLQSAPESDARAPFYLGNLFYDRKRYDEAIACWERSVELDSANSIALRNLGIAYFNVRRAVEQSLDAYNQAVQTNPDDARLWYERDQLWKRVGKPAAERLAALRQRPDIVEQRDDLTIEFCTLLNEVGDVNEAAAILAHRRFQPWEGGEGMALGIHTQTHLKIGHRALQQGDAEMAKRHFEAAAYPPENLGEARHLLANASDVWLAMGDACAALGQREEAEKWWRRAAEFRGDFQEMAVQPYSEFTYFQAHAWQRLDQPQKAVSLLESLKKYAKDLSESVAKIDYFATSLPTMLLFEDDLQARQDARPKLLNDLADKGLAESASHPLTPHR